MKTILILISLLMVVLFDLHGQQTNAALPSSSPARHSGQELPTSLADAEAWNFDIVHQEKLPEESTPPAFSPDFTLIAYSYVENMHSSASDKNPPKALLVIKTIGDLKLVKTIELPTDVSSITFSPDKKKIACIVSGSFLIGKDKDLLFVDLDTGKITPIKLDSPWGSLMGGRLTWPNPSNLYIHQHNVNHPEGKCLDLDTLKITELDDKLWDWVGKDAMVNNHKKAMLVVGWGGFVDGYVGWNNSRGGNASFGIDGLTAPYGRLFFKEAYDPNYGRYGWTPDLKLFYAWNEKNCTIYQFGIRAKPNIDFQLTGLEAALPDEKAQFIKDALAANKRILFKVFHAKRNPLNDKIIGPDRNTIRSVGMLTSLGELSNASITADFLPIANGDVASDFWIMGEQNFFSVDSWAVVGGVENK
jgi:hypothetical protein